MGFRNLDSFKGDFCGLFFGFCGGIKYFAELIVSEMNSGRFFAEWVEVLRALLML